jgi:hypothetical protein
MHELLTKLYTPRSSELLPLIDASPITLKLQETSVAAIIPPCRYSSPEWLAPGDVRG